MGFRSCESWSITSDDTIQTFYISIIKVKRNPIQTMTNCELQLEMEGILMALIMKVMQIVHL
ncbi:hypothetical protein [Clostridium sp. Marseille-Q7071]